jgi:hypothetical protein
VAVFFASHRIDLQIRLPALPHKSALALRPNYGGALAMTTLLTRI